MAARISKCVLGTRIEVMVIVLVLYTIATPPPCLLCLSFLIMLYPVMFWKYSM